MNRSKHSLSYSKKLSANMGMLVPAGLVEVLPGDTFQHAISALMRVSPLLTPVMHRCDVRFHTFFVPNRLVWDNWEPFITGGDDGLDDSVFPTMNTGEAGVAVGSLMQHLGVPAGVPNLEVSALPVRAAQLCYNEWYRDEDLIPLVTVSKADGLDTTTSKVMQNICWQKNYYTSARLTAQKGPAVSIPLAGNAPIDRVATKYGVMVDIASGATVNSGPNAFHLRNSGNIGSWATTSSQGGGTNMTYDPVDSLIADLSDVTAVNINDLRVAAAIQRYEENRSRYGSRYTELLRAWGVRSSDARLQRPEYLGGINDVLTFSEVLGTSDDNLGQMGGHAITAARGRPYRSFFEEHGFIITFMSVRPKMELMQNLFKHWNRRTKFDFYTPELANLGQEQVLNKEVYAAHPQPDGVFGYQDKDDSYRRMEAQFSGEFTTTLKDWHMGQEYLTPPALNADFVKCVPTTRIYASSNTDQLYVMMKHHIQARRKVPFQAFPKLM